jgi:transposase InsO family protein
MAGHMRTELARPALDLALGVDARHEGLLHHSDRGSQYAAGDYRKRLHSTLGYITPREQELAAAA